MRALLFASSIRKLIVWGNHSPTMYADYRFAEVDGKSVKDMINDDAWNRDTFFQEASDYLEGKPRG